MLIDIFTKDLAQEDDEKLTEVMIHITNKAHMRGFRDALHYVRSKATTDEEKRIVEKLIGTTPTLEEFEKKIDECLKTYEEENANDK